MSIGLLRQAIFLAAYFPFFTPIIPADALGHDKASGDMRYRPVTVADAIRMTRPVRGTTGELAYYSPDGAKVVVIVQKGNLESNTNEFLVLLWKTADLFRRPDPTVVLHMSSSSNRPAIEQVRWLADSETLIFLGERPRGSHQLFTLNIRTHALQQYTDHPTNLLSYSITPDGKQSAYTAEDPTRPIFDKNGKRNGVVVSSQLLANLVAGKDAGFGFHSGRLFFKSVAGHVQPVTTIGTIDFPRDAPFLSPNGRYIVIPTEVREVPQRWIEYEDISSPLMGTIIRSGGRKTGRIELQRYELVDTVRGENTVLLNSPTGVLGTEAAWSPDSRSVVITNTYLPLDDVLGDELTERQSNAFTVEVNASNRQIAKISRQVVKLIRWDARTNRLIFLAGRLNTKLEEVVMRKNGRNWQKQDEARVTADRPEIVIEEDMNTPPSIFALDAPTQQKKLLLNLNPQFKSVRFGREEEIHWLGSDGHDVKGGLYYPLNYEPRVKYPLVIQTHGFQPDKFWIDGPYKTAFAAQALAAHGIVVLQADEDFFSDADTPKEVDREVARFERAIDYLAEKRLIDRNRVGIIGFSQTCLFVKYALTHSQYHFAAASVTDGTDGGYFQYLDLANSVTHWDGLEERYNGGLPFGDGLKSWMIRSPGFNVDKVRTPVRITALNSNSLLFEWEWFAALTRLSKPVEMILLPDGTHELQKPWDRSISLQGNVDWFSFWLKGEEDPDPAKAEQYKRWRELRRMQEENDKKSAAPSAGVLGPGVN